MSKNETLSTVTVHFINELDCVNLSLARAVIKKMGGEDGFIKHHKSLCYTGINGSNESNFFQKQDAVNFFNANEKDIKLSISCISTENDFNLVSEYINHYQLEALGGISGSLSIDDIDKAMKELEMSTEDASEARIQVCHWIINAVVSYMCEHYANYLEEIKVLN